MKAKIVLLSIGLFFLSAVFSQAESPTEKLFRRAGNPYAHDSEIIALVNAGADINYSNEEGVTVLMKAAEGDRPDFAAILLRAGAEVSPRDKKGRTALYIATSNKYTNIVNLLKNSDALYAGKKKIHTARGIDFALEYLKRYFPDGYGLIEAVDSYNFAPLKEWLPFEDKTGAAGQFESRPYILRYISDSVYRTCWVYNETVSQGDGYRALFVNADETLWTGTDRVFPARQLALRVPKELRGALFSSYIMGSKATFQGYRSMPQLIGVYGLLHELSAHNAAMGLCMERKRFMTDYPEEFIYDEWRSYFSELYKRSLYYWELKYYIMAYLLHAKDNYPEQYRQIAGSSDFRKAFLSLDKNYSSKVEMWTDEQEEMLKLVREQGYYAQEVEPGKTIRIGRGEEYTHGEIVDVHAIEIDRYTEELQIPDYQAIWYELENTVSPRELYDMAANGDLSGVKRGLASGVTPDARGGRSFFSCLEIAALNGHTEVVRALIEAGARVDGLALCFAAEKGNREIVELLLDAGARTDIRDGYGMTPLNFAAQFGHSSITERLLSLGASPSSRNNKGWTPLHFAASGGHEGIVRLLLAKSANTVAVNSDGQTALDLAEKEEHGQIVQLLRQSAAVDSTSIKTAQPKEPNPDAMKLLLELKDIKNPAAMDDIITRGLTKLMQHATTGNARRVQLLIEAGADTSINTGQGDSALDIAAGKGHAGTIEVMMELGVDPNSGIKDSPLMDAAYYGHPHVVQILLEWGADPNYTERERSALKQAQWFLHITERDKKTDNLNRARAVIRILEKALENQKID